MIKLISNNDLIKVNLSSYQNNLPSYLNSTENIIIRKTTMVKYIRHEMVSLNSTEIIGLSRIDHMPNIITLGNEVISLNSTENQIDYMPNIITRDDVEKELIELENKYGIDSKEFYSSWKIGKAPDSFDSLKWASLYELWEENYLIK